MSLVSLYGNEVSLPILTIFPKCFLWLQQITTIKGWRQQAASSLVSESLHTNLVIPEVQRWRWVGGRRRRKVEKGMEDESGVEIRLAEHLCFHPSPSPPRLLSKKHSFPSSSSHSPPNPSLLHCICFLIRSVWEAHEPPPPPPPSPASTLAFLSVAVML